MADEKKSTKDKSKNWFVRHKIITGVVVLIVIIAVATSSSGGNKTADNNSTTSSGKKSSTKSEAPKETLAKIGQPAKDGKFEFTVNNMKCGVPTVGDNPYLQATAKGQFCVVTMAIKNIGDEAQTFDSSNTYLFDAKGAKYSADSSASIYANPDGSSFLDQINPGVSSTGKIVFDIPKDVIPVTAQLHDSVFSGGVKVSLK